MDMSEHKGEFASEAHEHMDVLNEQVLVIEKDPNNQDAINHLFRSFHTLKGNSALMGYTKFSELAHNLEDLLSKVRDKELEANKDVIEILFQGIDLLDEGLNMIEESDDSEFDAEHLIIDINSLLNKKNKPKIIIQNSLTEQDRNKLNELKKKMNTYRFIISFDPSNPLKNVKAMVIARDIKSKSEFFKTNPEDLSHIDSEFEIVMASKEDEKSIKNIINNVSGVKRTASLSLDEEYNSPEEHKVDEKEHLKEQITKEHHTDTMRKIQSVKVNMGKLDVLMNLVGELLINNIRLQEINKNKEYDQLGKVSTFIDRLIFDLEDQVKDIRMVPIGNIFNRYPRMVRDLAEHENKKINLVITGSELELDRTVLDQIGEPLVHLLRNSVDHGIESPEERKELNKNEEGTIKLIVTREKNHALIEIHDDGAGIDIEQVKKSAIKKNIISNEEIDHMSEDEIKNLIFRPGMSTAKIVTEVSGRGVGMDVVANKIRELGGTVQLESELGTGTLVKIKLPLTLAIISAMLLDVKGQKYVLPLNIVDQIIDVNISQIKTIQGHKTFIHRDKNLPLFWLHDFLGVNKPEKEDYKVVIANKNNQQVGIVVDKVVGQQQILIKALQDIVKGTKGCAGATIMGDGEVVLILDIETLI